MNKVKNVVTVIRRGEYPDSRESNRRYWLSRSPAERLEALAELRRSTYRLMNGGKEMPPMSKTVRRFEFKPL